MTLNITDPLFTAFLRWLDDEGWSPRDIIYAVEKPWKYETEFEKFKAIFKEETE